MRLAIPLAMLVGGCAVPAPPPTPERPMRIVSLDYCADQYVLKLVGRDRILAVSPGADQPFSYMRASAAGLRKVKPDAEDVLVLRPDLVVRSYGGGPNAAAFFESAGVPVLNVGFSRTVDEIPGVLIELAEGLGETERGRAIVAEMEARLERLRTRAREESALYITPAGVTTGEGTLVHDMLLAAGYRNFQEEPGWRPLPLERLAYERPDMLAAAFFGTATNHPDTWSAARHPVARRQMRDLPSVDLEGAWTACGGWFLMDAIEALAEGAR